MFIPAKTIQVCCATPLFQIKSISSVKNHDYQNENITKKWDSRQNEKGKKTHRVVKNFNEPSKKYLP